MKSLSLTFDGYWTEYAAKSIPAQPGIYCVYGGTNNSNGTVTLNRLVYIGESSNVRDRIGYHEKTPSWRRYLKPGEVLIFTFAPIYMDRVCVEAAMIFHHKPPVNEEYSDNCPEDVTMSLVGKVALLDTYFTVRQKVKAYGFYGK